MNSTQLGSLHCPFREFHCCSDGREGSKGISCMVSHLKIQHLCSEERKTMLRKAIEDDLGEVERKRERKKRKEAWRKEEGKRRKAIDRIEDGGLENPTNPRSSGYMLLMSELSVKLRSDYFIKYGFGCYITLGSGEVESHIVGILKPSTKDVDTFDANEGLVLDAKVLERVLQVPICTVKSIPHSCRLPFSRALKEALYKVVVEPSSIGAWVQLLLLPRCTLQVVKPQNRRDRRSGNRKSLQQHHILECLATWRETNGLAKLVDRVLGSYRHGQGYGKDNIEEENHKMDTNIKQCLRKVADGHFTAAIKVLGSSGVAPYNEDTMKILGDKHPYMPPPSVPTTLFSEAPLVVDVDTIFRCSAVARDLLDAITPVVNLWLGGRCPKSLSEFVASAPLTPLLKPDGGIRPIAVGTIWRRLVSKVAMKGVGKDVAKYLNDFQFGVGISGGAEAILHSANRLLSQRHGDGSLAMLTVDFSNAFNMVDRSALLREVRVRCPSISLWVEFLYGQAARLYLGDGYIMSATGVQQGDPLGPLLFALVLHPLVHKIRDNCNLLLHAWYLDDGTIVGDSMEVAKTLDIIREMGPRLGLDLNIRKTELFWPSCDGNKLRDGLFPSDIGRPMLGVKLLGGAVSRDKCFIEGVAMKRAIKAVELMQLLPRLRDPQSELLLLRSCMGIAKLFFGLRTCQPVHMEEAAILFDKGLRGAVEDIVVSGGPFFGDLQWRISSLPIKVGGLGLYSAVEAALYAFVASRAQSWVLQDHILRDSGVCGMDSDFNNALDGLRDMIPAFDFSSFTSKDTVPPKAQHVLASALFSKIVEDIEVNFQLTTRQKVVFGCLQAAHAQDFLLTIPIDGLGQHMSPVEYRTILKYRLMIPLFPVDEVCPVCRKACLDKFGEHAVHCRELPGFKYRHDLVRDVLFDVFKRAGVSVKKEVPVNFLTDPLEGRSTLRPADILVYGWVGGKHACVDLTGVSPLVGLTTGDFT
ncbi:hypothetical protein QL285_003218 [Trifolium repens]|nr:hypothetical protein QL285_003218 [Trifolium repens]